MLWRWWVTSFMYASLHGVTWWLIKVLFRAWFIFGLNLSQFLTFECKIQIYASEKFICWNKKWKIICLNNFLHYFLLFKTFSCSSLAKCTDVVQCWHFACRKLYSHDPESERVACQTQIKFAWLYKKIKQHFLNFWQIKFLTGAKSDIQLQF